MRRAAAILVLAACAAACAAPPDPAPARPAVSRGDIALAAETVTVAERVSRNATLETLLAAHASLLAPVPEG